MAARKITCTNEDNIQLVLTDQFQPWMLAMCDGIYEIRNNVSTSENTMTDGSTLQGSTARMRNIVLTLRDHPLGDHQANRSLLYRVFKAKKTGHFLYEENGNTKAIDYTVESVNISSEERSRIATVSLLCPDPFFTSPKDITVVMAGWVGDFEWPHEFPASGEEFGHKVTEKIKTIENEEPVDGIGVTITIEATGQASNVSITHVEQGIIMEIGTEENPLSLSIGDKIIITTHTNNKHVYLEQNGTRTEINGYLSEDSEFIQLMTGNNTFGYEAESGEEYLSVSISYRYRFAGV